MRVKALETILVLVLALLILYYLQHRSWLFFAAVAVGLVGLLVPALAEKIHWVWMKLAEGLGFVTSKILMTIIFFVALVPLSWLSKLFRKPAIKLKSDANSFFKIRNFTYTPKSMEDVW